jgi:hypothetical protein
MKLTPGELYFIRERDIIKDELTPYVKIGIVRDKPGEERTSEDRALEHQTGNPRKLYVESIIKTPAVSEIENILHNLYAEERIYGEWFDFTDHKFESVKDQASQLVRVAIENKDKFEIADGLSRTASRAETIAPTEEIIAWHSKLLNSETRIKECNALQTEIKNKFKILLKDPAQTGKEDKEKELAPFIKVQEKKTKIQFDVDRLALEKPDLYESFVRITLTSPKGSFTITRPKQDLTTLEEIDPNLYEFSVATRNVLNDFESGRSSQELLHIASLKLLGLEAKASWDKEIAKVNLKVFCNDYSGVQGICKWIRRSKEVSSFDKDWFIESNPDIAPQYMVEVKPTASVIVERKRVYVSKRETLTGE